MVTAEQIKALDIAQSTKNQGRGIQVIKDIVAVLNHGMIDAAGRIAIHDNDKIRNYPDIQKMLREMLPAYAEQLKSFETSFSWLDDEGD